MSTHITKLPHAMLLAGIPALLLGSVTGIIGYGVGAGWVNLVDPRTFGGIAFVGALFGVGVARVLWSQDLKHAQRIDFIRSRTECHMRQTEGHLRGHIAILESRLNQ